MAASHAAESEEAASGPQSTKWRNLVVYSKERDTQTFTWSDIGRHGLAILRKCTFLQRVLKACRDPGTALTANTAQTSAAAPACSGAARCLYLTQGGGCLVRAAAAFLEATWTELRLMALRELRDYAAVMAPLEGPASSLADGALAAAALYMWQRCPLWLALRGAPRDLLGELNEALVAELAPEPLAALCNTTAVLLDGVRAGLAKVGEVLAGRVEWAAEQAAAAVAVGDPDPEAEGDEKGRRRKERCGGAGEWLLWWRLHLSVHTRLEVWTNKHSTAPWSRQESRSMRRHGDGAAASPPAAAASAAADDDNDDVLQSRRGGGPKQEGVLLSARSANGDWSSSRQHKTCHPRIAASGGSGGGEGSRPHSSRSSARSGGSGTSSSSSHGGSSSSSHRSLCKGPAAAAAAGKRADALAPPLANGGDGAAGHQVAAAAATLATAAAAAWQSAPQPQALLESFVSACARRAADAALRASSDGVPNGVCGPFSGPLGGPPWPIAVEPAVVRGRQELQFTCLHILMQLREALSGELTDEDVARRVRQLSVAAASRRIVQDTPIAAGPNSCPAATAADTTAADTAATAAPAEASTPRPRSSGIGRAAAVSDPGTATQTYRLSSSAAMTTVTATAEPQLTYGAVGREDAIAAGDARCTQDALAAAQVGMGSLQQDATPLMALLPGSSSSSGAGAVVADCAADSASAAAVPLAVPVPATVALPLLGVGMPAELQPNRLSRLSNSPGLLWMQLAAAAASPKSSSSLPAAGVAAAAATAATSAAAGEAVSGCYKAPGAPPGRLRGLQPKGERSSSRWQCMRHLAVMASAATCSLLHQIHRQLERAHCVAGILSPAMEHALSPQARCRHIAEVHCPAADCQMPSSSSAAAAAAPCITALLHLPVEPLSAWIEAAAVDAGAAALAAAGIRPIPPADGTAALRSAAAAKAGAWVAARQLAARNGGGVEVSDGTAGQPGAAEVPASASAFVPGAGRGDDAAVVEVMQRWACETERRVALLLSGDLGELRGQGDDALSAGAATDTTAAGTVADDLLGAAAPAKCGPAIRGAGGGGAGSATAGALVILHEALLISAGRVRVLGASLCGPPVASGEVPVYRWSSPPNRQQPRCLPIASDATTAAAAPAPAPAPAAAGAAAFARSGACQSSASSVLPPLPCEHEAAALKEPHPHQRLHLHLTAQPTDRAMLLHLAVSACTAATNRLAHVVAVTHTAIGASGADLRPLCTAHSNALTLVSAAQALLGLVASPTTCAQLLGWTWGTRNEAPLAAAAAAAFQRSPMHAAANVAAGRDSLQADTDRAALAAAEDEHCGVPLRTSRRFSWRRSLRRIVPYRTEPRTAGHHGSGGCGRGAQGADVTYVTAPGVSPGLGQLAASAAWRPAVSGICGATEPIVPQPSPRPLPSPAPLCRIATVHLETAQAAAAHVRPAAAPSQQPRPMPERQQGRRAATGSHASATGAVRTSRNRGVRADALWGELWEGTGGRAGGSDRGLDVESATGGKAAAAWAMGGQKQHQQLQALQLQQRLAAADPMVIVLSDAEVGQLQLLHSVCLQLRAAAARAADVVEAEMGQRAATICRNISSSSSCSSRADRQVPGGRGGVSAGGPPSASRQVVISLLKPLREALTGLHPVSQSKLLTRGFSAVLRALRQQYGGAAGGNGIGRRSGPAGGWAKRQLEEGLTLLEEEFAAGWHQVEVAGSSCRAAAAAWVTGEYDIARARGVLEAEMHSLRSELRLLGAGGGPVGAAGGITAK